MTDIVADPTGALPVAFALPWPDERPSIRSVIEAGNHARLPDRRDDILAREVMAALEAAIRTPSPANVGRLHLLVADDRVLGEVEPLLARAARSAAIAAPARTAFARGLVTTSPDLFETTDPERLDRLVGLAVAGTAADGGRCDAGLTDGVLHMLRRFPYRGWPIVAASLESPFASRR
jgi:hypothetical protein